MTTKDVLTDREAEEVIEDLQAELIEERKLHQLTKEAAESYHSLYFKERSKQGLVTESSLIYVLGARVQRQFPKSHYNNKRARVLLRNIRSLAQRHYDAIEELQALSRLRRG